MKFPMKYGHCHVSHAHGPLSGSQEVAERTAKALLPTIDNRLANFEVWNVQKIKEKPILEDSYQPFLAKLGWFIVGFSAAFEGICAHNKSAELLLFIVSQPLMAYKTQTSQRVGKVVFSSFVSLLQALLEQGLRVPKPQTTEISEVRREFGLVCYHHPNYCFGGALEP